MHHGHIYVPYRVNANAYAQACQYRICRAFLKPENCVLFLGSGPLPLSLITLYHEHGVQGVGIEQNGKRAELSREVISRLGLTQKIRILEGNHFCLPLKTSFDLHMIAVQAEPKKEIFEYVAKILPVGSKVSYRINEKGIRKVLEGNTYFELPAAVFEEYLKVKPKPPVNNTVVFLIKK